MRAPQRHIGAWPVVAGILAVACLALGAWVLLDRRSSPSEGAASDAVTNMLENRAAAMNRADGHAAALFYAQDAVMEERDIQPAWVSRGRREIQVRLQELADSGLRLDLVGSPVQIGRYIGEPTRFYEAGGTGTGEGVLVFELDKKGLIAHQWIMGVTRP